MVGSPKRERRNTVADAQYAASSRGVNPAIIFDVAKS
jgi:hypothetical protein